MKTSANLVWIYKNFNTTDNPALYYCLSENKETIMIYSSYKYNVEASNNNWWFQKSLYAFYNETGKNLQIYQENIVQIIEILKEKYIIKKVFYHKHWEPDWTREEKELIDYAKKNDILTKSYYGNNIFNHFQLRTTGNTTYKRFYGFYNKCQQHLQHNSYQIPLTSKHIQQLLTSNCIKPQIKTTSIKFNTHMNNSNILTATWTPGETAAKNALKYFIASKIDKYDENRNLPAKNNTSKLSIYINYGVLSMRYIYHKLITSGISKDSGFIKELFWREFSCYSLFFYKDLPVKNLINSDYNWITKAQNPQLIQWQQGTTGQDIIDSSMRCLKITGFLHNRLRMIVAFYLVYDLNVHWKLGMKWFHKTLLDGDLASNSFNWQWISRTGFERYRYNKPFNHVSQQKKFDPNKEFIKQWLYK